jgi:hypothetical protein
MSADLHSAKIAHTLYPHATFYKKFPDASWRDRSRKQMQAQEDPGLADSFLISRYTRYTLFIEHKTGEGQFRERFYFTNWNERQRAFAYACAWTGIPYWIFLCMGTFIGARKFPLIGLLFTPLQLSEIENMAAPRKSLSYETALRLLTPLPWVANEDRWEIPVDHPFMEDLHAR